MNKIKHNYVVIFMDIAQILIMSEMNDGIGYFFKSNLKKKI